MTKYWHTFDFPEFKTEGKDNTPEKLKWIHLPESLGGKSVLDIGCWDGYFSFTAEKRGAKRVLAVDSSQWCWNPDYVVMNDDIIMQNGKAGFLEAHSALKSKVESKDMEIVDITKKNVGTFDIVLCLGILYHMKDPFFIVRNLYEITNEKLIIETHLDGNYLSVPAMIFYPTNELSNDHNNWWGMNALCMIKMLEAVGFKNIRMSIYGCRGVFHADK